MLCYVISGEMLLVFNENKLYSYLIMKCLSYVRLLKEF